MILDLVILDTSGEIYYSKHFPDENTAVELDSRHMVQFVSALGVISTTMVSSPEQTVLSTNLSKADAERVAGLTDIDRLAVERSLRSQPLCVVAGPQIYGVITIGYFIYIVRSSSTATDINFVNTFLFALQEALLYLRGPALRAGPVSLSPIDMDEDIATIEHLVFDTISSSGLRVLSRGVQSVHIDHITRSQLDRVLSSVFDLPYIKGAAIFLGHRAVHSKLDAAIGFVASCRLRAHPLAPEQRASQWAIFPDSGGLGKSANTVLTPSLASSSDVFSTPEMHGEAMVAVRLQGDCLLVLHVERQGYRITDILSFSREITAVANETGVVLPRNATNLNVTQLTECEHVIDLAVYRQGVFIHPTPLLHTSNGIFARFLSMSLQSLTPTHTFTSTSVPTHVHAHAHAPTRMHAPLSSPSILPFAVTSVSGDNSDSNGGMEGVQGSIILRQQGYAFYFSVHDGEAIAVLFHDAIDTMEMENVVFELKKGLIQYFLP